MKAAILASVLALGALAPGGASAQSGGSGSSQQNQYGQAPPPGGGGAQGQQQIQAGGLAPPPPMQQDPESAATEEKLTTADQKDSGRGLEWFYLNAEIGAQHLGLQTFKANGIVDSAVVNTTQTGPLFGAGLGLRVVFVTLGGRFRLASFKDYQLWTLGAEVGLRIPLGSVEPYFVVGGGYASLGSLSGGGTAGNVSVTGYDLRAGGGLDYYVTPVFSVGANLTGDLVGLTRPGVSPATLQPAATPGAGSASAVYAASGSSLGMGISATVVLGLHF
jgi:hypothetical protein